METPIVQQNQAPAQVSKTVTVSIWTVVGVLGSAVLVSIVGTAFTIAATANSDHFLLQSTATAVTEIKSSYVDKDVYAANQASVNTSLRDIKNTLSSIDQKINSK